jgi:putative transcriptional regulator
MTSKAWSDPEMEMIRVRLDYLLVDRRMKLKDVAEATGLAVNNLSILKTGKARAIRFTTLNALCKALACTPGDLLEYVADDEQSSGITG